MLITVKVFSEKDIVDRVNLINNPMINKYMFFDLPATFEKTSLWYHSLKDRKDRIDFVARNNDDEIVSMFGLTNIDTSAELYILNAPKFQGKGIGYQLTQWLINFGFLTYRIERIYLIIDNGNIPASKIYSKCGFNIEEKPSTQKLKDGKIIQVTSMSLLLNEWNSKDWKNNKINFEIAVN